MVLHKSKHRVRCVVPHNCFVRKASMHIGQYTHPMIQIEWPAMAELREKHPDLLGLPSIFAMHKNYLEVFPAAVEDVCLEVTIERGTINC